jgi:hypothetical protein
MATGKPELIYIALCRDVRENADGTRDLIGVFRGMVGSSSSGEMPPLTLNLKGVASFYLEDRNATYPIRLAMRTPDGREMEVQGGQVGRFGHLHTSSFTVICNFTLRHPGVYWFCCYWEGQLLGRYPLTIDYQMLDEEAAIQ